MLRKFISDRGKIRARRVTGVSHAAAASDRQGSQERPRDGSAPVHDDHSLSKDRQMKLILTQEVDNLGLAGDVVEVADGYGRNYLVPRGSAIGWTKGGEKQITQIKRARDAREIRDVGHAKEIKADLEKLTVTVPSRAGKEGKLFGSITESDVAAAVKSAGGPLVDKKRIQLPGHIKVLGKHEVTIDLQHDVLATIAVTVVAS